MSNSSKSKNDAVKPKGGSVQPPASSAAASSAKRTPASSSINTSTSSKSTITPSPSGKAVVSPRKTDQPYTPEQTPTPHDSSFVSSVSSVAAPPPRTLSAPLTNASSSSEPFLPYKSGHSSFVVPTMSSGVSAPQAQPKPTTNWQVDTAAFIPDTSRYNPYTPFYPQQSAPPPLNKPSKAVTIKNPETKEIVNLGSSDNAVSPPPVSSAPSATSTTSAPATGFSSNYSKPFVPKADKSAAASASTESKVDTASAQPPATTTSSSSSAETTPTPASDTPKAVTPNSMFPEFKKDDKSAATAEKDDDKDDESKKKKKNAKDVKTNASLGKEFDAYTTKPKEKETKPEPSSAAPSAVASSTSSASSSSSESKDDDDDEDSWDNKKDDDIATSVLKNSQNIPLRTSQSAVPYRPPGMVAASTTTTTTADRDPNWAGAGGDPGKKMYDRNFLLQFQEKCKERPANLPSIDVILGNDDSASLRSSSGFAPTGGRSKGAPGDRNFRASRDNQTFPNGGAGGSGGRGGKNTKGPGGRGNNGPGGKQQAQNQTPAVAPLKHNPDAYHRADVSTLDEDTVTLRKANGHLNKLAVDNFVSLSDKIIDIPITSVFVLDGIIAKIFEKALSEPKFVGMYANLCAKISGVGKIAPFPDPQDNTKNITFRRALLNKCQEEFESNQTKAKTAKAATLAKEGQALTDQQKAEQELENTKARKRYLGNIKFIGELYKCDMLTEKIMHECIIKLLGEIKHPSDEDLEALCKLLSTIGKKLDQNKAKAHMESYFTRINTVTSHPSISPRIKFALEEVMELRKNSWVPRRDANAPKTIKELHKEAAAAEVASQRAAIQLRQREKESGGPPARQVPPPSRSNAPNARGPGGRGDDDDRGRGGDRGRSSGGSGASNRSGGGSSSAPPQDDGWNTVPTSGRRTTTPQEPQKAKPAAAAGGPILLAPSGGGRDWMKGAQGSTGGAEIKRSANPYANVSGRNDEPPSRTDNNRGGKRDNNRGGNDNRGGDNRRGNDRRDSDAKEREPPAAPPKTMEQIEKELKIILDELATSGDAKDAALCVKDLNSPSMYPDIVNHLITSVLEKKDKDRDRATSLIRACLDEGVIPAAKVSEGFSNALSIMEDLVIDIPLADKYVGQMMGDLIATTTIGFTLTDTLMPLVGASGGAGIAGKIISEVFKVLSEKKPELAEKNKDAIPKFYKADYKGEMATVGGASTTSKSKPSAVVPASTSKILDMLSSGEPPKNITDYVKAQQVEGDENLARGVIRTILTYGLKKVENGSPEEKTKSVKTNLEKYAMVVSKLVAQHQQAALFEVQGFWDAVKKPKGMMDGLFECLYDACRFDSDTFILWSEDASDPTPGKTEALVQVNQWLDDLKASMEEADDEDGEEES